MRIEQEMPLSGEALYDQLLHGDRNAMEGLVELYGDGLMLFIQHFVYNPHDAEEIVIDAFARLALGGYRGHASLKTYLYAIARNLAMRHLKKNRRHAHLPFDDIMYHAAAQKANQPEDALYLEERKRQLLEAMKKLNAGYRTVLHLLYFEEMSYADAGKVLKKSERQIANLAYHAKAALKKVLEGEGFTYEE